jgi:hypothetical protein
MVCNEEGKEGNAFNSLALQSKYIKDCGNTLLEMVKAEPENWLKQYK